MADRCTGDCCRRFYLPYPPKEIAESYRAWREQDFDAGGKDRNGRYSVKDIWIIAPMVRHVGLFRAGDPNPAGTGEALESEGHYYRCVHIDGGDCGIYETRPRMCRVYPNGRRCGYPGCTWGAARDGRVTRNGVAVRKEVLCAAFR